MIRIMKKLNFYVFEIEHLILQEKEKELDVRNIYSMRVMKPPHKLNSALTSTSSTPAPSSRKSTGSHQRKNSDPWSPHHRKNQKAAMQEVSRLAMTKSHFSTAHVSCF